MVKSSAGNNLFLKKYNETTILDLIRVHGEISRFELSKMTGLSPTAIGVIAQGLLEKGYVHETGTGKSSGGRRPVMLQLCPGSFFSVGIDIDVDSVSAVLMDITNTVFSEASVALESGADLKKVQKVVAELIAGFLKNNSISVDRLLGVGISVPGLVDSGELKVVLAPNLGWKDVMFEPLVIDGREVPVHIENEAMASAICENWIGACKNISNFVCINIKTGIGAGIFTDGKPYRGVSGSAGEVGHIVVNENGPKCGCGNHGCLETVASTAAMVKNAGAMARSGGAANMTDGCGVDGRFNRLVQEARAGNANALKILYESASYLGIAISSLINTLNPERIVVGKEFVKYADLVIDTVNEVVMKKALRHPAESVSIVASTIGEKSSTLGAAIVPLKKLFGK